MADGRLLFQALPVHYTGTSAGVVLVSVNLSLVYSTSNILYVLSKILCTNFCKKSIPRENKIAFLQFTTPCKMYLCSS